MKTIVCENYEAMSKAAADIFSAQLKEKSNSIFGLATGGTPVGLYAELAKRAAKNEINFENAVSYNLDEYYPMKRSHECSYYTFMNENLFSKVKFKASHLPNGEAADPHAECLEYDRQIEAAGGIDLQLLGIGLNGHIGFNEPDAVYETATHLTSLTQSTMDANSRFFKDNSEQPHSALTMGMGAIFGAKKVLLLISGKAKAELVKKLQSGKIYTDVPASLLLLHKDVVLIVDKDAAGC